jgi:hypothetical protein
LNKKISCVYKVFEVFQILIFISGFLRIEKGSIHYVETLLIGT